jgi:hypothetical protein
MRLFGLFYDLAIRGRQVTTSDELYSRFLVQYLQIEKTNTTVDYHHRYIK